MRGTQINIRRRSYENINTKEEVGKEIGVTRERVRQIQMDALKKLKRLLEQQGFSVDALLK
jgi:RNA polymerase nonessential primary-like sigma factor